MLLPKLFVFLLLKKIEKLVRLQSKLERKTPKDSHEQNHSQSENIRLSSIVLFLSIFSHLVNLWSHIPLLGSLVVPELQFLCFGLEPGSEAKVSNFENILFTLFKNEYVLQFEVAVSDPLGVKVVNSLENVFQGDLFLLEVRFLLDDVVEEAALCSMFKHEDTLRGGLLILLITLEGHILTELMSRDDVRVVQGLESLELIFEVQDLPFAGGRYCFEH